MPDDEIMPACPVPSLRCREGWVFLGCLFQDEWETFSGTVQRGDLLADPRFSTREARQANDAALSTEIAASSPGAALPEWEEVLIKADIGCVRPTKLWRRVLMRTIPTAKRCSERLRWSIRLSARTSGTAAWSNSP